MACLNWAGLLDLGCWLRVLCGPGLDCGDEDFRAKVHGFVLGAGFWASAFLLLVVFVLVELLGKISVLD